MLDAINTYDTEFLAQQVVDGKVKHAEKETKIAVIGELNNGEVVEIKFLQGRYKNKIGYTLSECVKDVGREREQAQVKREQQKKEEEARREREQAAFEEAQAKDTKRFEQLSSAIDKPLKDGVQTVCEVGNGTPAYCKIIGVTNLPDETNINVTIGTFTKGATVYDGGKFSVLIGRSAVSVGEQNLSITTLDGKQIYSGTIQVQ